MEARQDRECPSVRKWVRTEHAQTNRERGDQAVSAQKRLVSRWMRRCLPDDSGETNSKLAWVPCNGLRCAQAVCTFHIIPRTHDAAVVIVAAADTAAATNALASVVAVVLAAAGTCLLYTSDAADE